MLKRTLCIIMVLMLSLSFLVGCNKNNSSKSTDGHEADVTSYPSRNLTGYIAFGAGGATDSAARGIAPSVEDILGRSIILVNKTGATGAIAAQEVYNQSADGYSILFSSEAPGLYKVLGLSELDYSDFEPIMLTAYCPMAIVVPPNSPYNTIDDLLQAAKNNPGKLNIGITGFNGGPFAAFAAIGDIEGVKWNYITYDGEGPMVSPLMDAQIDASAFTVPLAAQYIESGSLKTLGVLSSEKNNSIPNAVVLGDVKPEYKEFMRYTVFYGAFVNKNTPKEIIDKLVNTFEQAIATDEYNEFLNKVGFMKLGLTGEDAKQYLNNWRSFMSWLIYDTGNAKYSPEEFQIKKVE